VPLGRLPNWGNTPENADPGDVLYLQGFMNPALVQNQFATNFIDGARVRMQVFLSILLQEIIIDASAQGIHFTDTQRDVTTPQYGYMGQAMLPFPGARYRISLDRDIFLREATRPPDESVVVTE
jgi:hypothetical protein